MPTFEYFHRYSKIHATGPLVKYVQTATKDEYLPHTDLTHDHYGTKTIDSNFTILYQNTRITENALEYQVETGQSHHLMIINKK